ncbi:SymE family type I addiction module toxin [Chryseobacterium sp.]|uniref:SymE family type I addiction module toxin n=1 Tax=Chryseobacterium sp. TaxID=1871047 RepID=UPI00388E271F
MFFKKLKICYQWQGKKQVPKLNISGAWLQNAGFEIGKNIKIEVSQNKITIYNDDKNA